MAKRLPLDTRFAIADAFDSGQLRGECNVNDIAAAVGANPKSVGRSLIHMGFACVRKAYVLNETVPTRWAPPRKWPDRRQRSDVGAGILDLYETGRLSGRCYARDIAPLLDTTAKSVTHALRRLNFTIVKRQHMKFVRIEPAVWSPPRKWPELFEKQRELRRGGMSTGAVMRATDLSASVIAIIDAALNRLYVEDVPLFRPGVMKAKIRSAIREVYFRGTFDNVTRQELASWLGESPDAHLGFLQSRIEGYTRFASKRTCQHCGKNPAKLRDHRAEMPIGVNT